MGIVATEAEDKAKDNGLVGKQLRDNHRRFLVTCYARFAADSEVRGQWAEEFPGRPFPVPTTIQWYKQPRVEDHPVWGPVFKEEREAHLDSFAHLRFADHRERGRALAMAAEDAEREYLESPKTKTEERTRIGDDTEIKSTTEGRHAARRNMVAILDQLDEHTGHKRLRHELSGPGGGALAPMVIQVELPQFGAQDSLATVDQRALESADDDGEASGEEGA